MNKADKEFLAALKQENLDERRDDPLQDLIRAVCKESKASVWIEESLVAVKKHASASDTIALLMPNIKKYVRAGLKCYEAPKLTTEKETAQLEECWNKLLEIRAMYKPRQSETWCRKKARKLVNGGKGYSYRHFLRIIKPKLDTEII